MKNGKNIGTLTVANSGSGYNPKCVSLIDRETGKLVQPADLKFEGALAEEHAKTLEVARASGWKATDTVTLVRGRICVNGTPLETQVLRKRVQTTDGRTAEELTPFAHRGQTTIFMNNYRASRIMLKEEREAAKMVAVAL